MRRLDHDPSVRVVIGLKWGDEGKGKIVDAMAETSDVVMRFQGGSNAGHNVLNPHGDFALHSIPSGIFDPHKIVIIGSHVATAPHKIAEEEIPQLERQGVKTDNLVISSRAPLNLPLYGKIDMLREARRGGAKIGTTGQGIGPVYTDKTAREGLAVGVLRSKEGFFKELDPFLVEKRNQYPELAKEAEFNRDYYEHKYPEWMQALRGKIQNVHPLVQRLLRDGNRFLLEGAQGVLLDNVWGPNPGVTSSFTTLAAAYHASGIPMRYHKEGVAVTKAYDTKVGSGGMPAELPMDDPQAVYIREKGNEVGATSGRPRRIGYYDFPAARYSQDLNGFDWLIINSVDVLEGAGEVGLCLEYSHNGKIVSFPDSDKALREVKPVWSPVQYEIKDDFSKVREYGDLLPETRIYAEEIARMSNIRLGGVGIGRRREDLLLVNGFSL